MRTHHGHWSYLYQLIAVNRDFDTARLIILCYEQMEMADFLKPASTSEGELRSAVQRMLLCGDSLIGHNRVCDHPSIAMLDKDEANLFLGIVSMEKHRWESRFRNTLFAMMTLCGSALRDWLSITCSIFKTAVTAAGLPSTDLLL